MLWHQRLGHPSYPLFSALIKQQKLPVSTSPVITCDCCNMAKSHKLSFSLSKSHTSAPFQLVHMDVWGPSPVPSNKGYRYYLLIIDDFSRYSWIFPLHYKSEVKYTIANFKAFVFTQFHTHIQCVRSDNGGEFVNNYLLHLFLTTGVVHQTSCPHTPEQNGLVERKHRHLIETTITLLLQSSLPSKFWLEALVTAVHLANLLPHSSLQFQIPHTLLFKSEPNYLALKPFGCTCFPWLKPYTSNKLQPKSQKCIFLGYCATSKGYKCYDPISTKVFVSRHVKFVENEFPYSSFKNDVSSVSEIQRFSVPLTVFDDIVISVPYSVSSSSIPIVPSSMPHLTSNVSSPVDSSPLMSMSTLLPSQSSPVISSPSVSPSVPSQTTHSMTTRSKNGIYKPKHPLSLSAVVCKTSLPDVEPSHFNEAIKHSVWQHAMAEEYKALVQQGTWTLVEPPSHANVIGCQWIYKLKRNSDGTVARHKARLVANGNQQAEGLDYTETFSPVIKQPTLRIVFSLAVHHHWPIRQLDVSNAFLHGVIEEEVYMRQPLGYKDINHPHFVCKLNKALYGLRQAPRAWFSMFSSFLLDIGFVNSKSDTSLFILHTASDMTLVLVYVDDIVITGSNTVFISDLIAKLSSKFVMKDLGPLSYFLGIEIQSYANGLLLTQAKYASDLLIKSGMQDCKPCYTPSAVKPPILQNDSLCTDPQLFRTIVGSLQYLTLTRPEIAYAVNLACQHMHAPTESHFIAVKRILRYIKGTLYQGLRFLPGPLSLTAFSDADWAGDSVDRRSTTGYCLYLGTNLISWCAKKQPTVARSSTEAEYRALAATAADITWVRYLLQELHIPLHVTPIVWCDNKSAIALASNPIFHARTKHVEIDYHFIREKVLNKELLVQHIGSAAQIADIFTKALSVDRFLDLKSKLMVIDTPISLRGAVKQSH